MASENLNNDELPQEDEAGSLRDALASESESEFVVPHEKKSISQSTLVLIGLVALGGAGLYGMHLKTGPKAALAAPESRQAGETIKSFLSDGDSNIKVMEKMLKDTEKVVQRFLKYPSAAQVPLQDLSTNPFKWLATPSNDSSASEILAKKRREAERQAVIKSVQMLQLQSVMAGSGNRACMINNTMIREGQSIDGFTVEKISSAGVIVRQNRYRFELKMQK